MESAASVWTFTFHPWTWPLQPLLILILFLADVLSDLSPKCWLIAPPLLIHLPLNINLSNTIGYALRCACIELTKKSSLEANKSSTLASLMAASLQAALIKAHFHAPLVCSHAHLCHAWHGRHLMGNIHGVCLLLVLMLGQHVLHVLHVRKAGSTHSSYDVPCRQYTQLKSCIPGPQFPFSLVSTLLGPAAVDAYGVLVSVTHAHAGQVQAHYACSALVL